MVDIITYNHGGLHELAEDMMSVNKSIAEQMEHLGESSKQLIQTFLGDTSQQYETRAQDIVTKLGDSAEALRNSGAGVQDGADEMKALDKQLAATFDF